MLENLKLEFTIDDMQVIDSALAEMPYRISAPVIERINKQLRQLNKQTNSEVQVEKEGDNGQT
jgi:hypothetical protein